MSDFHAEIPGARELVQWFGQWPSFHDAEVVSLELNRTGPSALKIHTWEMTDDLDSRGYYVLAKHLVVTFVLIEIQALHLDDFSHQNVLSGLSLAKVNDRYELHLGGCYGLQGSIAAAELRIEVTPGIPAGSVYSAGSRT
jgi:hypothetical protein